MGIPLSILVRPLDNPWLESFLNSKRTRFGQRIISNRGGLWTMIRDIGEGRSVAIMIDLNMRGTNAVFVDYFGVPAATAPTSALLARKLNRPIVPYFVHRGASPMEFEIEVTKPIWPDAGLDKDQDIQRMLQTATNRLEERVRAAPGEWLWSHRRFKSRPPEESHTP
jgi:KDO2-lipid IV(A) lauroyltransferase